MKNPRSLLNYFLSGQKITRHSFFLFLGYIFYNLVSLIILFFITRRYAPNEVGLYLFAFTFANFFVMGVSFGSNQLLTREIARNKSITSQYVGNIIGLNIFLSLICFSLIILILQFFSPEAFWFTFFVSIALVINQIAFIFASVFLVYRKIQYNLIAGITSKVVLLGLFFLFLSMDKKLIYLPLLHIASALCLFLISAGIFRKRISKIKVDFDFSFWRALIKNSVPFFVINVLSMLYFRIDTVMISLIRDFSEVGFYNTVFNVVKATLIIPIAFSAVIYPVFSNLYHSQSLLKSIYKRNFGQLLIISIVLTLILTLFSKQIVLLAFGEKFLVSSKALFVLSLSIPFIFINKLNATALFSVNLEKWPVYILISGAFINVILNALVIPQYGFIGAAVTTVITEIIIFAVLGWAFYRRYWIARE